MKTIILEQRSTEWLDWRKSGVGASESAAILGMSKYKGAMQVWESKTSRAFPTVVNADMQRGIDMEEEARHVFQNRMGIMYIPVCAEHDELPFIKASFDGVTADHKSFVELKCPRSPKLRDAIDTQDQDVVRELFPDYFCQVQHQYAVCEKAETGYLAAYQDGKIHSILIERDDNFIKLILIKEITEFWNNYVLTDKEPPLSSFDYIYIEDADTVKLAEQWVDINSQIKSLQEQEKALRVDLADKGDDGNIVISDVLKMTRVNTKGRVNTKKLYVAFNITEEDLDKFRGEQIGSYRFTPIKS